MQNLRIVSVQVVDSSNIDVTFTEDLTPHLITSNVSIISDTPGAPSSDVLIIKITGSMMSLVCQPLTPMADYFLTFQSILPSYPFQSVNGDAVMPEDGITNKYLITAPLDSNNPIKNYLDSYFSGNIYEHKDSNTIVAKFIQSLSIQLSRALYDIRQVQNENYLSFNIIDEQKIRGTGPFDRLNEESAYEIIRVGRTATGANITNTFQFDPFPSFPVTLQKQSNVETLTANSIDAPSYFNINSLTLNLSNFPVTKVTSIIFTLNSSTYTYDITKYGYQILDSRYDQDYGFTYLQLANNQIVISDKVLEDPLFLLDEIIKVDVLYESKNQGIVVNASTVSVFTTQDAIREALPPIINVFNLKHAPIVNASNNIPTLAGVTFIDPNASAGSVHPAFKYEIPFRLEAPPASPGQYSIDYTSATIYVYGSDSLNDGTGPYPPLATYKYRLTYQSELDYVYDPDLLDIVALPTGSLVDFAGTIGFNYEEVLIPNVDYAAELHGESLTERIGNRLVALNAFKVLNPPITNVFRIFNETSGEIYTLSRWSNDKVYFRYNTPPRLLSQVGEKATFNTIVNELLFVNTSLTNTSVLKVFKIFLNNNAIVSSTEDSLASSFNTSLIFSDGNIFISEKWFDREFDAVTNINRLTSIGQYMVDYTNGVAYCAVSSSQGLNIGTVTYKNNNIVPIFPHIITPDDIYYQISSLNPKNKQFAYTSFDDASIVPETLDPSDEGFLNNTASAPYQIYNNSVGVFLNTSFSSGVTNEVKFVRSVFEYNDLENSTHPFNFNESSTSSGYDITVASVSRQIFDTVQYDIDGYYVIINENIPYLSPNISYTFSIVRTLDSSQLWSLSGTIVPGNPVRLTLPNINSPLVGDQVNVTYTIAINNLSRVLVDYNKGDYFVDYTYLADEIVVSYEHGDNVLDFRHNYGLPADTEYFVSYKAGALRDALLKNFGTLVNVPELANFDIDFDRERYRDALSAALTSFIQGPTVTAIKNIGQTISHIEPEIIESAFVNWSLGSSILTPEPLTTTGAFQLLPAKFDNGALIDSADQTIKFPVNASLRLEEGTFETWISPQWNGLDNQATLTFNILKDGYTVPSNNVFIGSSEYHPTITNGVFSLDKNSNTDGLPNMNKDGVFIYYDNDISGSFSRWYMYILDGYVSPGSSAYKIKISSTGNFYDSKSFRLTDGYLSVISTPSGTAMFTGVNTLNLNIPADGYLNQGITLLSDAEHYLLDFGKAASKDRLSIYKDATGYMNFRVFDKNKTSFSISADVSDWRVGDLHHVAASWKLNTYNGRDEMHLFLDGFEVPNIIKYGNKLRPYLHEKFRTVNPEEIIGSTNRDIIASIDLHTTYGSATVSSSINFGAYNIFAGDTIFIDETGFSSIGYTISSVNGQSLVLSTTMPATLTNARFSINRAQFTVTSDIDISPNIAVTTIHKFISGTDGYGTTATNIISSLLTNFTAAAVQPGYLIKVDGYALLETTYTISQVFDGYVVVDGPLSTSFGPTTFRVYSNTENEIPGVRATRPAYSISKDANFNNILTVSNDVVAGDLILIRTLGLNHRRVKKQYYVWSNSQENILMTRLPSPISLDETKITKVILPSTFVGPTNSTLFAGIFTSNNFAVSPPSTSQDGRSLSATISGNNVNFASPVLVTVNGVVGINTVSETISFTDYGTLDFVNKYISLNYINIVAKPLNSLRNALTIEVKEKYSITHAEASEEVPVIRYSYHIGGGYTLYNDGYGSVRDDNFLFSGLDTNNYLVIKSPITVAGYYKIVGFSADRKSLHIEPTNQSIPLPLPAFTNGIYEILNVNQYRSGLQNGFFTLETKSLPPLAYFLGKGFYELEYATYTRIQLDPINELMYLGSNFSGNHQLYGILDQVKIYSTMLTDTRTGETIPANQRSITKDFNSLKALKNDVNTLALINFNTFPFTNDAKFYINSNKDKQHFQSNIVINENFGNSVAVLDRPIVLENSGILDTKKEGTVEFWVNPLFDTGNDPVDRFYFDAFGAVIEETVSVNNVSVKLSAPAGKILSVKLKAGDDHTDYFAGGKIELDTQHAIQETVTSISNSSVVVSKPILQVITVKAVGDLTGTDYFSSGIVGTDGKTIYLGKTLPTTNIPLVITYQTTENKNITLNTQVIRLNRKLPYQNTKVVVNYVPQGLQGDRLSIFKDPSGYVNFAITASNTDYVVRAPTLWAKDTWHRIKASYKLNGGAGHDEMRLFLDGYEYTNVTFGMNILFGPTPIVFGSAMPGGFRDGYAMLQSIQFKDPINTLFIGTQYNGESPIFSLIDNFRISDVSRPLYAPYGEPLDVNYSTNLSTVFPVTEDLFTTFLMDFDKMIVLNDDFSILKNRKTGLFDFTVNIIDSFGIVNSNIKSQEALEALIKVLKPANSRVFIEYIR